VRTTNTKETTMKTRTTSQTTNLFGVYEYGRLLATFATREEAQAVKANRDATLPAGRVHGLEWGGPGDAHPGPTGQ
jgi:hypothetical protein